MTRTVYLGTSAFAATVLHRLAGTSHRPALVVAPPDRRRGRGRTEQPPPVAAAASELGIDLVQTADANGEGVLDRIRSADPDAGVVCAFGQIIREPLLGELEILNIHPSLLPRWRGAAPIERAIMAGDEVTGVCVMRLTEGLDSGPVAVREPVQIQSGEDYGLLSERLAELGGELLVRALDARLAGDLEWSEQEGEPTYAEKIGRAERLLSPERPAIDLERTVRALTPHIGAQLEVEGGDRLGVRAAAATGDRVPAGAFEVHEGALLFGCATGSLRIDLLQPPGGKPMQAAEYLRGHDVPSLPDAQ